jgi:hypothetical protein
VWRTGFTHRTIGYDQRVNARSATLEPGPDVAGSTQILHAPSTFRADSTPVRRQDSIVVIGIFAAFTYLFLSNSWIGDDAYIMFRVVDNFVSGYGLRWNTVERVQAFTSPLWVFVLSPFYAVTREVFFPAARSVGRIHPASVQFQSLHRLHVVGIGVSASLYTLGGSLPWTRAPGCRD